VEETPYEGQEFLGSYNYLAPEIFKGEFNEPKSDVWSIGAILFTLLSGEAPFSALDEDQVKAQILKGAVIFRCNISSLTAL
jgi:serine/threonine protein kinase